MARDRYDDRDNDFEDDDRPRWPWLIPVIIGVFVLAVVLTTGKAVPPRPLSDPR